MTIKQLIEKLKDFPEDYIVLVEYDNSKAITYLDVTVIEEFGYGLARGVLLSSK